MRYLLLILALATCKNDESLTGYADGTWQLVEMNGAVVSAPITLDLNQAGRVSGQAPCNGYFADLKAPLPWFQLGPVAATKRACPELSLEAQYFETLAQATLAEVSGQALLLSTDTGPILVFKKTP